MGDKRIPISESHRDALKARKRGDDTYDDVIERLLTDTPDADANGAPDPDTLADAVADRVGADISEAIWDALDADELAQQTAAYVESTDTVTLEASERRAIAEDVAKVLQG